MDKKPGGYVWECSSWNEISALLEDIVQIPCCQYVVVGYLKEVRKCQLQYCDTVSHFVHFATGTTPPFAKSFFVPGLAPNSAYFFRVRVVTNVRHTA